MIFFRRKKRDPEKERLLDAIEEAVPSLVQALGIEEPQWRRRKDSVEAIGKAPGDADVAGTAVVAASYLGRFLEQRGYRVVRGEEVFKASDIYKSTGSLPVSLLAGYLERELDTGGTFFIVESPEGGRFIVKVTVFKMFGRIAVGVTVDREGEE